MYHQIESTKIVQTLFKNEWTLADNQLNHLLTYYLVLSLVHTTRKIQSISHFIHTQQYSISNNLYLVGQWSGYIL